MEGINPAHGDIPVVESERLSVWIAQYDCILPELVSYTTVKVPFLYKVQGLYYRIKGVSLAIF